MTQEIKMDVLQKIAVGRDVTPMQKYKWRVQDRVVHVRYCSRAKSGGAFPFNINPNTLTADFEVWICGNFSIYYLFPMTLIRQIYEDPKAYVDRRHPEIRVAEVNPSNHRLLFGQGGKALDASSYFQTTLRDFV